MNLPFSKNVQLEQIDLKRIVDLIDRLFYFDKEGSTLADCTDTAKIRRGIALLSAKKENAGGGRMNADDICDALFGKINKEGIFHKSCCWLCRGEDQKGTKLETEEIQLVV